MEFDKKILNYNLTRLGFQKALSNTYEYRAKRFSIRVTFLFDKVTLIITQIDQSVKTASKIVKSLFGLDFKYGIEESITGTCVTFKVTQEGYKGLLRILESLQKLLQ